MSLFITLLVSQNLFARTYGGTGYDEAESIIQTSDGGYAVAGRTTSFSTGDYDLLVLKLDPAGNLIWARTFGGTSGEGACSITQTLDGGLAVAGYTNGFGAGTDDFIVLKLNNAGNLIWARTFGGAGSDMAYSIIQASDGGLAVAGRTNSFGAGSIDFLVLKVDSLGNLSWAKTFGGTDAEMAYSMIQTADSGYAVAGCTRSFTAGDYDFLVLRLDTAGNLIWSRTFGLIDQDLLYSITRTTDGGFTVAGQYEGSGSQNRLVVLRLDPAGNMIWLRTFGAFSNWYDVAYSVIQTSDGDYAVTGWTYDFGAGWEDFFILKIMPDGSLRWARTFGGTGYDEARSIIQTTDGGYAVAGYTPSFGAGNRDFLVLKMDTSGNYTDCVQPCSPVPGTFSPSTSSPSVGANCTPTIGTPGVTINTPGLTITDVCASVDLRELDPSGTNPGITCSPFPGGALFISPEALGMRIYAVDGRLAFSGNLQKGENRILLDRGVYLWMAENYRGKAVVR
jgi:hypothetical protein